MVLYIDGGGGGRVSSINFRGILASCAVKNMSVRFKHTVVGSSRLNQLNLRAWDPVNMVLIP